MADGWRGLLKKWLEGAAQSLERRPVERWTQEQQRLGIAVTIAAIATAVICLFGFMIFDSHIEKSRDVVAVVGPPQSLLDQEKWPCKRSEDNRASDLCAQWKAADAARKAADWSVFAFIIGTGVNVLTLLAVALGWIETRKATAAANEQVKIARYQSDSELRAWIGIKADIYTRAGVFMADGHEKLHMFFKINIENFGKRPAIGLTIDSKLFISSDGSNNISRAFEIFKKKSKYSKSGICILPGERREFDELSVVKLSTAKRLGRIFQSRKHTFIWPILFVLVRYKNTNDDAVCENGYVEMVLPVKEDEVVNFDFSNVADIDLKSVAGFDHHVF